MSVTQFVAARGMTVSQFVAVRTVELESNMIEYYSMFVHFFKSEEECCRPVFMNSERIFTFNECIPCIPPEYGVYYKCYFERLIPGKEKKMASYEIPNTSDGDIVNDLVLNNGDSLTVNSGGTAVNPTVSSGGRLIVNYGGSAQMIKEDGGYVQAEKNATVTFLPTELVKRDVTADNSATVHSGTATSTYVSGTDKDSCATLFVMEGGSAYETHVDKNGRIEVRSGGTASGTLLENGATGAVYNGGVASNTVLKDASLFVNSGGLVSGVTLDKGQVSIGNSATASGVTVNNGKFSVALGGIAYDTVLNNSGSGNNNLYYSGSAVRTVINKDAVLIANDYAYLSGTTISSGGSLLSGSGCTVLDTVIGERAVQTISSGTVFSGVTVKESATLEIGKDAGAVDAEASGQDAVVHVLSGGTLTNGAATGGGRIVIDNDTIVSGTLTMSDGGTVTVVDGAVLTLGIAGYTAETLPILVNDMSQIEGTPDYRLRISDSQGWGEYFLAGNAAGFNQTITVVGEDDSVLASISLDSGSIEIGDYYYTLALSEDNNLVLTVGEPTTINGPDEGLNDWLYEGGRNGRGENEFLVKSVVPALNYDSTILLDEKNSIYLEDDETGTIYRNYVGKVTYFEPREIDPADFAKIVLDTGARLQFSIDSWISGKFVIYSYDEETHKMKALQSTGFSVKNNTPVKEKSTVAKLLEKGTYYIAMLGTIPQKTDVNGYYNVELTSVTHFFLDDDDLKNNWLYEKGKKGRGLNNDVAGESVAAKNISRATKGKQVQVDVKAVEHDATGKFGNFVGFGDETDYVKVHLDTAANLSLTVESDCAVKLTIYQLTCDKNGNVNGAKALQTTTLKAGKGSATSTLKLLQTSGDYYIAVTSTNAKKGDEAYYNVLVNDRSVFFDNCDDHTNDWLYEGGRNGRGENTTLVGSEGITIVDTLKNVQIDASVPTGETGGWKNFVGFGDTDDYQKIVVKKDGATVRFKVDAKDQATFTIYSYDKETHKVKALQTSKLRKDGDIYTVTTSEYTFKTAGEYYISVTSTNAKKGGNAYYNVELVSTNVTAAELLADALAADLAMPEISSGLNLTDDLSFGPYGVDALPDVSASSLAELNDKSAWQNLAKLA